LYRQVKGRTAIRCTPVPQSPQERSRWTPPRTSSSVGPRCRFGVFEFDDHTLELSRNGRPVPLRPQPLKLLATLLARPGTLISRDDLQRALWDGDTFVDFEQGVNHAIRELRAALGDTAESPRFIQTLPRRGYRFIAPVERLASVDAPASPPADVSDTVTSQRSRPWWAAASIAAVIGTVAIVALVWRPQDLRSASTPMALAVRPFSAPADPTLGIGLAQAVSARLSGQQSVRIRSIDADASHVLEGEISIAGNDITVEAHLRELANQATLWSDRISVRADRLLNVEDVIAERVVSALRLRLAAAEQDRLRRRYTSNNDAYFDYLRGRAALAKYSPAGAGDAVAAFESALRRDANYALARAGLAMASADMYLRFASAGEVEKWGERAEAESRTALALDADLAEAHLARAAVARKREFDWQETVSASRRALLLNPNLEQAHFFMAAAYYHHGYMEESLIEMRRGRNLNGLDTIEPIRIEALVALFSGSFAPARAHLEEVSRLSSQAIGDTYLALAYYYSGSADRGRKVLEALINNKSASTAARASAALAGVLAAMGEPDSARTQIDRVLEGAYRDHHVAYSLGAAYAQLGETDEADQWLRTAADTGFPCLPLFEQDPLLEPLRRRAAFSDLVAHVRARRELSLPTTDR
jgi:DNA-binding winged helix-turn-helix (wHTH) protein/tetratricopeptide (TPR) repeat protein